jgi:hypothetical protein
MALLTLAAFVMPLIWFFDWSHHSLALEHLFSLDQQYFHPSFRAFTTASSFSILMFIFHRFLFFLVELRESLLRGLTMGMGL